MANYCSAEIHILGQSSSSICTSQYGLIFTSMTCHDITHHTQKTGLDLMTSSRCRGTKSGQNTTKCNFTSWDEAFRHCQEARIGLFCM